MTITKEIKNELRNVYSPLKRAYELKGTVFSSEFERAEELADERLDTLYQDMSDSAFGLWKLGLLPKEEMEDIRKCASKLHRFVVVSVEHFRNLEKETYGETAYYSREYDHFKETSNDEIEFIDLYGTKEAYVENSITGEKFDDIDITLEDMLSYFNMVK
jgi:hypothetical protein